MTKRISPESWEKEFHEFIGSDPVEPPKALSEQILSRVRADMHPAAWRVFSKVALVHLVVGTLSLLFCPQFGLSISGNPGMFGLLMYFGDKACMLGCGAVFLTGTAFVSSLVLSPEEIRAIRRTGLLQFSILSIASLGVFLFTGANIALGLGLFWILGSVLGGMGSLELGWLLRRRLAAG
jgi:hypothetical protein